MFNLLVKQYDNVIHSAIQKHLENTGWEYIGCGSFRTAFRRKNAVIKVPHNQEGFEDNLAEAYAYRKYRSNPGLYGIVFAPCRLLPSGCLLMPYIARANYMQLPNWAQRIDGAQAGKYKDRFVAYDSGFDIKQENKEAFQWAKVIEL